MKYILERAFQMRFFCIVLFLFFPFFGCDGVVARQRWWWGAVRKK